MKDKTKKSSLWICLAKNNCKITFFDFRNYKVTVTTSQTHIYAINQFTTIIKEIFKKSFIMKNSEKSLKSRAQVLFLVKGLPKKQTINVLNKSLKRIGFISYKIVNFTNIAYNGTKIESKH